jgi:hypothetical protein
MPRSLDLAENLDRVAGLELFLQLGDDLADVIRNAAEIAALGAGVDVVDRLDVGLVQIGRNAVAAKRGHVAQEAGYQRAVGSDLGGYRGVAEVAERTH